MEKLTIKIKKVNDFKYAVKDGRKTIANIVKVSDGWCGFQKMFWNLEEAMSYTKCYCNNTFNCFEDKYEIEVIFVK